MYETNLRMIGILLETQRKSMRLYIFYAIIPVVIGITVLVLGQTFAHAGVLQTITSVGGTFIASIGGFSLKEFLGKRDSIMILMKLQNTVEFNKDSHAEQENYHTLIQNMVLKSF